MKPKNYVGIFVGNGYISQVQHGLQAGHVVAKLFVKYDDWPKEKQILFEWTDEGPTKWLLNGGYQERLEELYEILKIISDVIHLPYAKFHEEISALNGALTSVGFVVDINKFPKTIVFKRDCKIIDMLKYVQSKRTLTESQCYAVLKWLAFKFDRA